MIGSGGTAPLVLLVEDNETIRHAFSVLLEDAGYRVAEAGSGAEALEVTRRERPQLIVMDLGLPDIGGLEVTRQLKADPETRDIIVVALTGRALEADRRACLEAGCSAYYVKPVDTRQLLRDIDGFVR